MTPSYESYNADHALVLFIESRCAGYVWRVEDSVEIDLEIALQKRSSETANFPDPDKWN